MFNSKILSNFSGFWTPIWLPKVPSDLLYGEICCTKLKVSPFLVGICMGGTLGMSNFKTRTQFFGETLKVWKKRAKL
jgi:hypothetical protein